MKKSPPFPLIIIVLAFIGIPVVFWAFTFNKESDDVKGLSTEKSGIVVNVLSKNGAWDMYQYMCEDKSTCLEGLTSGKSLEKTSGGGGSEQSVSIIPSIDWGSNKYIKIFVKSGWGSTERSFDVKLGDGFNDQVIEEFDSNGDIYKAVILSTDMLRSELVGSMTFTD